MAQFFAMGGYAAFVWPCYALAVVVMAWLLLASLRWARNAEAELETVRRTRSDRPRRDTEETE